MHEITLVLLAVASSPWAYIALAGLLIVDGFFPFVPGETFVVLLATLAASGAGPHSGIVLAVAVVATIIGDGIAFILGRTMGLSRFRWMRGARARRVFAWAADGLHARPIQFLGTAKFVPFARVAVTMTAGASGLPVRRYLPVSIVVSIVYTGYHVLIGMAAGSWLDTNPLLASAVAIVVVFLVGFAIEQLTRARARRRGIPA